MKTLRILSCLVSIVALPGAGGTQELAALGKLVFFDPSLSDPPGQSCASCHLPQAGFADPDRELPVSRGALPDRVGSRNAQSVTYAAFSPVLRYDRTERPGIMEPMYVGGFFWDGRARRLEDQVKEPFLNPLEMNNAGPSAVVASVRRAAYAAALDEACGAGSLGRVESGFDCVARALSAYLRSPEVNPFTSKFDHWQAGRTSLTPAEERGFELFTGKAKCKNCHSVEPGPTGKPLFSNFGHQNTGAPRNPNLPFHALPAVLNPEGEKFVDRGLGEALRKAGVSEADAAREDGKFKIPSLRNCTVTAPYMHNGVFRTLREVVVFNNTRDVAAWPAPEVPQNVHRHVSLRHGAHAPGAAAHRGHGAPEVDEGTFGRLGLTDAEVDDLVAFLETLTDGWADPDRPVLRVYGPGGPAPAMKEAAAVFGKRKGASVRVTAGPTAQWKGSATEDADLIYSGSEYMMADFVLKDFPGQLDPRSVRTLYLRPAAVLVRPGNPRGLTGLRDLGAPGVKVLVVQGAGQVGMWEDAVARTGDVRLLDAVRRNIGAFAANSAAAKKLWADDPSYDAWLIWTIWQKENPASADLVEVEPEHAIYRSCGIGVTTRSARKALAEEFVRFIESEEGREIFVKWGWRAP